MMRGGVFHWLIVIPYDCYYVIPHDYYYHYVMIAILQQASSTTSAKHTNSHTQQNTHALALWQHECHSKLVCRAFMSSSVRPKRLCNNMLTMSNINCSANSYADPICSVDVRVALLDCRLLCASCVCCERHIMHSTKHLTHCKAQHAVYTYTTHCVHVPPHTHTYRGQCCCRDHHHIVHCSTQRGVVICSDCNNTRT